MPGPFDHYRHGKGDILMKVLFQGDSITDVGRNTEKGSTVSIGQGYALMVAGDLGARYPGKFTFVNNGVSGNRIVDLYARIKTDIWNEEPDVLSILLGINDVWHDVMFNNGVDNDRFYEMYSIIVKHTLERLPDLRIMLLEPFVLKTGETVERWGFFDRETRLRQESVRRVAMENGLVFVPLQKRFDEACMKADPSYWIKDGVHPTPAGHRLIADAFEEAFERMLG